MDINAKQKWFTLSWFILLLIIIIFLFYGRHVVKAQDKNYSNEYQALQYVKKQLSKGGQPSAQVTNLLTTLYQENQNDYIMNVYMGELYVAKNNPSKAADYYQMALNIRPALLTEAVFTYQYGELEYYLKHYQNAKKLLNISLNDPNSSQYKAKIQKLLNSIQQVSKK